ncbi:MAG TPA: UDP-2,4-diacetamido-2,4,6-trideoxy-beta-L-altropyranose hydrolase [Croceibacterium sp.]|nr:UDP-2,4-diacetamido-2,4,6-trideoxy-beta-L-altropyranose hydrolase [Croceibacterium sp.]
MTPPPVIPQIAFRTDASLEIGTGHVMRCLTLADVLRQRGADCTFICRAHDGHLLDYIRQRGHRVQALSGSSSIGCPSSGSAGHAHWLGADWKVDAEQTREALGQVLFDYLVVDHYGLDRSWEKALRSACHRLMVMDDLADRPHDCDLLLDPSLGRERTDYGPWTSSCTQVLLGPNYALLRPEFAAHRNESLARRTKGLFQRLLITMGGVDKVNATGRVLGALERSSVPRDLKITVIMGPNAPWLDDIQAAAARMPVPTEILVAVDNMAQLMAASDLAIGAAGGTSWERCCMGLPTIQFILADNQIGIADALAKAGAAVCADGQNFSDVFSQITGADSPELLKKISKLACEITDGLGAERVSEQILGRIL